MSGHTPGPWLISKEKYGWLHIYADGPSNQPKNNIAAILHKNEPDAKFIAHACNAHDEMLEALKWCIHQFQGDSGTGDSHWEDYPEYVKARDLLQALEEESK